MSARASQITSLTIAYSTFYSGADQGKYQSSASLAYVRGIHRWPVNSPHKGPVTRVIFPFDDVIMYGGGIGDDNSKTFFGMNTSENVLISRIQKTHITRPCWLNMRCRVQRLVYWPLFSLSCVMQCFVIWPYHMRFLVCIIWYSGADQRKH